MTLSIYQASIPVYVRRLEALSEILDKAVAFATVRKIAPGVLLQARLFPDMFPLAAQVQIACGHAMRGSMRLSGAEPLVFEGEANSFDDLKVRISKTLEVIKNVDAKKMNGMEDRDITFPVGDRKETMKGSDYLLKFSMPNFYFHLTTAYGILRHNGVDIGKDDFMGDTNP